MQKLKKYDILTVVASVSTDVVFKIFPLIKGRRRGMTAQELNEYFDLKSKGLKLLNLVKAIFFIIVGIYVSRPFFLMLDPVNIKNWEIEIGKSLCEEKGEKLTRVQVGLWSNYAVCSEGSEYKLPDEKPVVEVKKEQADEKKPPKPEGPVAPTAQSKPAAPTGQKPPEKAAKKDQPQPSPAPPAAEQKPAEENKGEPKKEEPAQPPATVQQELVPAAEADPPLTLVPGKNGRKKKIPPPPVRRGPEWPFESMP